MGRKFPGGSQTGRAVSVRATRLTSRLAWLEKRACAVGIELQVVGRRQVDIKENAKLKNGLKLVTWAMKVANVYCIWLSLIF